MDLTNNMAMSRLSLSIRGRGAIDNPPNRFEPIALEPDPDFVPDSAGPAPQTTYLRDISRTIIARNDSPDVGFECSINPYRGCEHGCIYCYARPTHEYFGLGAGLDFETKIFVKLDAPRLLRKELSSRRWQPQVIALSGVTDCYQPIERRLQLTRQCLQVLAEFRNPVCIITKNHLITRDIDVLCDLARHRCVSVLISITTLDADLSAKMEPRTAAPARRLAAIAELSRAGIPVGVMVAPIIPGLTDHEIPAILSAAARAGARSACHSLLRLPGAVATLFEGWLDRHYPDRKGKILGCIRWTRDGKLNDSRFSLRMRGQGQFARQIHAMFSLASRRCGLDRPLPDLSTGFFRCPQSQMELWTNHNDQTRNPNK